MVFYLRNGNNLFKIGITLPSNKEMLDVRLKDDYREIKDENKYKNKLDMTRNNMNISNYFY